MLKLGILKFSGSKSLSKPMHLAALKVLGLAGEYSIYECLPENLKSQIQELKDSGVRGVNVTIPHKIPLMKLVDKLTDRAKLVGAVNTVIFEKNEAIGENTDLYGFFEAIPKEFKNNISESDVALLGCGGAACACAIAFIQNNVKTLKIFARDINKLKSFKADLEIKKEILKSTTNIEIGLLSEVSLKDIFILTNTTPVGMSPDLDSTPIPKEKLKDLKKDALVYDIIYNPSETLLLKDAKSLGYKTLNGVEMLVLQGAESLKLWTNRNDIPIDIMRKGVLEELTINN